MELCQHASNDTVYHVIMKMTSMYTGLLGWAWVSPTPTWLHCVYACLLVCLAWPLMVNFKWVHSHLSWCWNVHTSAQTYENEDVGLLPDCTVSVKESKSKNDLQFECIASTRQLCDNYESDDRAWQGRLWVTECMVVRAALSTGMIAHTQFSLLAHDLSVKLLAHTHSEWYT